MRYPRDRRTGKGVEGKLEQPREEDDSEHLFARQPLAIDLSLPGRGEGSVGGLLRWAALTVLGREHLLLRGLRIDHDHLEQLFKAASEVAHQELPELRARFASPG